MFFMKSKYILTILFSLHVVVLSAQNSQPVSGSQNSRSNKRIFCSYYNYEQAGIGYMYNHSWNNYIRAYNAVVVPPAGITNYRWGRPFTIGDLMFSWGYSKLGSPHNITITTSFSSMGSELHGRHLSRNPHLSGSKNNYPGIDYDCFGIGLGYMHSPPKYASKSSFFTYGGIISATANSFSISYPDSLNQSTNSIYATKIRGYINYNITGDNKSISFLTLGIYAEYFFPNQLRTDLLSKYLSYPGAPASIYVNPASIGLTLSYAYFPHIRKNGRKAVHSKYGESYTPIHTNISQRNFNTEFKGKVEDSATHHPVSSALITFSGTDLKAPVKLNSNSIGKFDMRLHLSENTAYAWMVLAEGYFPYYDTSYTTLIHPTEIISVVKDIKLRRIQKGDVVKMDRIFFLKGSDQLSDISIPEMDNIITLMDLNPFMKIRINGYTSNEIADEKINIKLSLNRAKAIKKYMKGKGVTGSRIKVKGYGSSHAVVKNDTEEHREMNRRVEFVVIKL